ncbi:uncharacterized protein LOC131618884 [Vicia villosa]|uniref:uncharacterized protein LOC131618884 n=1 Tax=Vicia villosa TaxID=3911 RepID=UPI00273C9EEE|nr:uncharacterized protein LOC131618884 [Vicia villosa]
MDNRFNNDKGPPSFRIQGQSCHKIGSMLPMPRHTQKFVQLYIYDTGNEIQNRVHRFRRKNKSFDVQNPNTNIRFIYVYYREKSDRAELLKLAKLIIWDEAPLPHKYCFEALDKTLQYIMTWSKSSKTIFRGKVVVFGGDFRQILPVLPRGSPSDIIYATINSSYIWDHCKVLRLTNIMRLHQSNIKSSDYELEQFSDWILKVGDAKLAEHKDSYANITIPSQFSITGFDNPIQSIVEYKYPNFKGNFQNEHFLHCRAILVRTIEIVDVIKKYVSFLILGEEKEYLSADTVNKCDGNGNEAFDVLTMEFLNTLTTSGLPNH